MIRFSSSLFALGLTSLAPGAVTYVDADPMNTILAGGGTPTLSAGSIADGNWDLRTGFANGSTAYQGGIGEDAPRLQTTVSGLNPGSFYDLKAYFWGADGTQGWRGRASVHNSATNDLPGYNTNHSTASVFDAMTPVTQHLNGGINSSVLSTDTTGGTGAPATESGGYFAAATPVLVAEGNRSLYEVPLGPVIADAAGNASVFIDDLANTSSGNRTWYDGIGYEQSSDHLAIVSGFPVYAVDIDTTNGGTQIETANGLSNLNDFASFNVDSGPNNATVTVNGVTFDSQSSDGFRNRDGGTELTTDFLFDDGSGQAVVVAGFQNLPLLPGGLDYQVEVWAWDNGDGIDIENQIVGFTTFGTNSGPLTNETIFTSAYRSSPHDPFVFRFDDEFFINNASNLGLFTREANGANRARLNAFRITVVPEPTRALLLGLGLSVLAFRRRR